MGYLLVFPAPSLFNSLPPSKADVFKASQGCFLFYPSHKEPEYTFNSLYQNETKTSACIQDAEEPVFPRKGFGDSIILSLWVFRVAVTNSLRELNKEKKNPFLNSWPAHQIPSASVSFSVSVLHVTDALRISVCAGVHHWGDLPLWGLLVPHCLQNFDALPLVTLLLGHSV